MHMYRICCKNMCRMYSKFWFSKQGSVWTCYLLFSATTILQIYLLVNYVNIANTEVAVYSHSWGVKICFSGVGKEVHPWQTVHPCIITVYQSTWRWCTQLTRDSIIVTFYNLNCSLHLNNQFIISWHQNKYKNW